MFARIVRILASRNWQLVSPDDQSDWQRFVNHVIELIDMHYSDDQILSRAVTTAYCPILYTACADHGSERQDRAFEELWHWIYPRVYARITNTQDAADAAQKVQIRMYQNLHQVREPHAFLGYVSATIHHEVVDYYRHKGRTAQFEQEPTGDGDDNDAAHGMDTLAGPNSFLEVEVRMAEEAIVSMIRDCLPKGQRRRVDVLIALAVKGKTVPEVAEALRTTPTNVHLMYFRAKRDLLENCRPVIDVLLQHLAPSQRIALMEGDS